MLRRLFSSKWVKGGLGEFAESAPLLLSGSESPLLILSGPFESGKSTALNTILGTLCETEIFSGELVVSTPIRDSTLEHPLSVIAALNASVTHSISHLEPDFPTSAKHDLLSLIVTYARKLGAFEDANPSEEESLVQKLDILNEKIKNYSKIPRLKSLSPSSLLQVVEKLSLADAYEFVTAGIITSSMEATFGEESSEMLVKTLNTLNKYCTEVDRPTVILKLEDTHIFYRTEITKDFYTCLVQNILKSRGSACVLEGASQFESTLVLLKEHASTVDWFHFEDLTKEEASELWAQAKPGLSEDDKAILWDSCFGNISLVHNMASAIADGEMTPSGLHTLIRENALASINSYLDTLHDPENDTSLKEKALGVNEIGIRAVLYVLKNLAAEPNKQLQVEIPDFSTNGVMQELVIQRLLKYCAVTQTISFDKGFLPEVLPKISHWGLTSSWLEMRRNRYAYDKICSGS